MKRINIYLSLLLMAGLMGCSTALVKSDFDRNIDFTVYETFDWAGNATDADSNAVMKSSLLDKRLKRAIENELAANGFYHDSTGTPNLLIKYDVAYEDREEVTNYGYGYYPSYYSYGYGPRYYRYGLRSRFYGFGFWPGYYGFGYGYGAPYSGGVEVRQYKEVTITIEIIDPDTKELVWRGWYIDETNDENLDAERVDKAVKRILEKFPPEQLADAKSAT